MENHISNPDLVERFENNLEIALSRFTLLKAIMIIQLLQNKIIVNKTILFYFKQLILKNLRYIN
jgi:hypothetical protein